MKKKLTINDDIFFIKSGKVVKAKIKGISTYSGEIKSLYRTIETKPGEVIRILHYDTYEEVSEKDAFGSEAELKEHLFGPQAPYKNEVFNESDGDVG